MESTVGECSLTLRTKYKQGFSKCHNGTGLGNCLCSPLFQDRLNQNGRQPVLFISLTCHQIGCLAYNILDTRYHSVLYCTSVLFKIISLKINNQDKADKMERVCGTHGEKRVFWWESQKENDQ